MQYCIAIWTSNHLQDIKNQILCIKEAKRFLKDDGKIFATFLNNDMVPLRESFFNLKYFESDNYDHGTFDVFNFPYTCHTIEEARNLFKEANLIIKKDDNSWFYWVKK